MKRALRMGMVAVLMSSWVVVGTAEAGVGTALKNLWTYSVSPVNCLLNLGTALIADVAEFGRCFVANLNRNPANLQRLTNYLPTEGP